MANVRDIKNRIKSVQNIQQITRAMKMIAAARIKKVERMLRARRPYCERLYEIIDEMTAELEENTHPLLRIRGSGRKAGLLVISGDKGLCGSYNASIIRRAERAMSSILGEEKSVVLYTAGLKAYRRFLRKKTPMEKHYAPWNPDEATSDDIANTLSEDYLAGKFDELNCIYTKSVSLLTRNVVVEQLFPIKSGDHETHGHKSFLFEPEPGKALEVILPMYIRENLMRILLDAKTSELSARINAMANATENAEKLVGELRLNYFRARQEAITTEILEIVSGAESMKKA